MPEKKAEKEVKKEEKTEAKKVVLKADEKLLRLIKLKRHPVFRGSFGTRSIRPSSIKKWNKWHMPGGETGHLRLEQREDGSRPKTGYRTNKLIRYLHPSGFEEVMVFNVNDLNPGLKDKALRISGNVGRKKRLAIAKKADELNLKIVNRCV